VASDSIFFGLKGTILFLNGNLPLDFRFFPPVFFEACFGGIVFMLAPWGGVSSK
jgi:hypothetical protein